MLQEAFSLCPFHSTQCYLTIFNKMQKQVLNPEIKQKTFPPSHFAICEPKISSPFPTQSTSDPATQSFDTNRARAFQKKRTSPRKNLRSSSVSSNQMLDRTNFVSMPTSRGVAIRGAGARPRHPLFALYGGLRTTTSNRHSTPTETNWQTSSLLIIFAANIYLPR